MKLLSYDKPGVLCGPPAGMPNYYAEYVDVSKSLGRTSAIMLGDMWVGSAVGFEIRRILGRMPTYTQIINILKTHESNIKRQSTD